MGRHGAGLGTGTKVTCFRWHSAPRAAITLCWSKKPATTARCACLQLTRCTIEERKFGEVHPGIRWGPFTLRIPFYHFGFEWPEAAQGFLVAGATGLALIPIMEGYFGVSYSVALCVVIVQSLLISNAPTLFGDPYCHGWITPSIVLVLAVIGGLYSELGIDPAKVDPSEAIPVIRTITALTLMCGLIFLVGGITGLGRLVVEHVPVPLKAGIIFGAAVESFRHELDPAVSWLYLAPKTCIAAVSICLILTFSQVVAQYRIRYRWVAILAGLGLIPGFVTAMVVGWRSGELSWSFDMTWNPKTWIEPMPFGEMWQQLSPFAVGFPTWDMFIVMLPTALIVYIIGFGDMVTGNELLREAEEARPDEKIDINPTRIHLNCGIRNTLQGLIAGPFPVSHGPLWTGVQVVVTERYKQGREGMDTLFGGISAYYFWGIPLLLFLKPITQLLRPTLPVALSITILLTGFACGYLAMMLPRNNVERGVAMVTGMVLALVGAWQALLVGLAMTVIMCGWPFLREPMTEEP